MGQIPSLMMEYYAQGRMIVTLGFDGVCFLRVGHGTISTGHLHRLKRRSFESGPFLVLGLGWIVNEEQKDGQPWAGRHMYNQGIFIFLFVVHTMVLRGQYSCLSFQRSLLVQCQGLNVGLLH